MKLLALILSVTFATSIVHAQFTNMSARTFVGTGTQVVEASFTLTAASAQNVLLRAAGPTLGNFGVPGTIADPIIEIYQSGTLLESNSGWDDTNGTAISSFSSTVGAFSFAAASEDAAILRSLSAGHYTVKVYGTGGTTGIGLTELYVAGASGASFSSFSYQSVVDNTVVGFANGSADQNVLFRLLGPELGVDGVADPSLALKQSSTTLDSNDDWGGDTDASLITGYSSALGLDTLNNGSSDSAFIHEIDAASYTLAGTGNGAIGRFEISALAGVSAVPEPGTYATLLGLGVLGLASHRRRGRRA